MHDTFVAKIHADFRFIHSDYERWALEEYLTTVKAHVSDLESKLPSHLSERLNEARKSNDEGDFSIAHQEVYDLRTNILPRLYCNTAAIAIYSALEFCIRDVVRGCEGGLELGLGFTDINGANLLDQSRKFFERVVGIPFCHKGQDWEKLKNLAYVRNCIVHAGGRLDFIAPGAKKRLDNLVEAKKGLRLTSWDDCLAVEPKFLDDAYNAVNSTIVSLVQDAKRILDQRKSGSNQ